MADGDLFIEYRTGSCHNNQEGLAYLQELFARRIVEDMGGVFREGSIIDITKEGDLTFHVQIQVEDLSPEQIKKALAPYVQC